MGSWPEQESTPEPARERRPLCDKCRALGFIEPDEFDAWWRKNGRDEIASMAASKPKPTDEEVEWASRASSTRPCPH